MLIPLRRSLSGISVFRWAIFLIITKTISRYVSLKKGNDIIFAFQKPKPATNERGGELVEPYRAQLGANVVQQLPVVSGVGALN